MLDSRSLAARTFAEDHGLGLASKQACFVLSCFFVLSFGSHGVLLKATEPSLRTETFLSLGKLGPSRHLWWDLPPRDRTRFCGCLQILPFLRRAAGVANTVVLIAGALDESSLGPRSKDIASATWALLRVIGELPGSQRGDARRVRAEQRNR